MYEAIFVRKSVRNYVMEPLEERTLQQFEHFLTQVEPLKSNIKTEFKIINCLKNEAGERTPFPKGGVKAPYYLLLTSEEKPDHLPNAGYLMQQAVLYLTAKEIGTCYQGLASFSEEITADMEGEYVMAIAFGTAKGDVHREPQKMNRMTDKKTIIWKEEAGETLHKIVKAALAAPSACNFQPWRLVAYENRVHLFCRKNAVLHKVLSDMQFLDMGILMANFNIAAEELWMGVNFKRVETLADKNFKSNEYVMTALLREKVF